MKEKYKLPEPFRSDWIKDLRDNVELQGYGCLYRYGKFCCLGRACLLAGNSLERINRFNLNLLHIDYFDNIPFTKSTLDVNYTYRQEAHDLFF